MMRTWRRSRPISRSHALDRLASGELHSTLLMAKGSLFLGRMTQLWDGASITLDAP